MRLDICCAGLSKIPELFVWRGDEPMKRQLGGKRGGRKRKIYPQSQLRVKLEDLSCNYQPLVTRTESSYLFILHGFWEGYEKRNCKSALFWSAYFSDLAGAEGIGLKVLREFTGNLNNFIDIMPPYNFQCGCARFLWASTCQNFSHFPCFIALFLPPFLLNNNFSSSFREDKVLFRERGTEFCPLVLSSRTGLLLESKWWWLGWVFFSI